MKRLIIFILAAACIGMIWPQKASAFDLSVGAATWYAQWDLDADKESWNGSENVSKGKPAFLYGPALAAKINDDFSLTFVYLFGKMNMKVDGEKKKYERRDADLALNYRLNSYFKVFAGIKYMGFEVPFRVEYNDGQGNSFSVSGTVRHYGYGPGAGISFTYPVFDNLFLLGNLSGIYLWGKEKLGSLYNEKFYEYGANSGLALAYYIEPASTVISLGGRYQYVRAVYEGQKYPELYPGQPEKISNNSNHVYGVTLTATYTFSF